MIRLAALVCFCANLAGAEAITSANYADPTSRYPHGVLGDRLEWGTLVLRTERGPQHIVLPPDRVFEDTGPRLADLDGDGAPEVIVVESQAQAGAQLAIYNATGKIAATPHIGTRFRWLAPIGVADLDGDGLTEIAYIDRPHLAKTLRVWRYVDGALVPVASAPGLTNHRIGEPDIGGGIRHCSAGPEMITASSDWSDVIATRLSAGSLVSQVIGRYRDRQSFSRALACAPL